MPAGGRAGRPGGGVPRRRRRRLGRLQGHRRPAHPSHRDRGAGDARALRRRLPGGGRGVVHRDRRRRAGAARPRRRPGSPAACAAVVAWSLRPSGRARRAARRPSSAPRSSTARDLAGPVGARACRQDHRAPGGRVGRRAVGGWSGDAPPARRSGQDPVELFGGPAARPGTVALVGGGRAIRDSSACAPPGCSQPRRWSPTTACRHRRCSPCARPHANGSTSASCPTGTR